MHFDRPYGRIQIPVRKKHRNIISKFNLIDLCEIIPCDIAILTRSYRRICFLCKLAFFILVIDMPSLTLTHWWSWFQRIYFLQLQLTWSMLHVWFQILMRLQFFDRLSKFWYYFKQITNNSIISSFEKWRFWIFIDHYDGLAVIYTS